VDESASTDPQGTQHEAIRVAQKRAMLVRQMRHDMLGRECCVVIQEKRYEIINLSAFGIAIRSPHAFSGIKEYIGIPLVLGDLQVATIGVRKVREEDHGELGFKIAFEISGDPIPLGRIFAMVSARDLIREHQRCVESHLNIPEAFKAQVYECKDYLENLMAEVNALEDSMDFSSNRELYQFERAVCDVVADYLHRLFGGPLDKFYESLKSLPPDDAKHCIEFFRAKVKHLVYQSSFSKRSFEKPLGYAGDFEMMNLIYRDEAVGRTLFAKCLHRYYVTHPAAQAVRNRAVYLQNKLMRFIKGQPKEATPQILSVASGPAKEIQDLVKKCSNLKNITFHLLDQDLSSLTEAQRGIKEASTKVSIKYLHKAIRNVLEEGLPEHYDLIYTAGLFDYFTDKTARQAAAKLFDHLIPGGLLIIGNFTASHRTRSVMELALDWHLIYRNEADLKALYSDITKDIVVESEPEGINLFTILKKAGGNQSDSS
jgi:hypothetical protein